MALEEMYIASSITSIAAIGVFVYLHRTTAHEILKTTWLSAIFLFLYHALAVIQIGFRDIIVHAQSAELAFTMSSALMWLCVGVAGYFILQLLLMVFRVLRQVVSGASAYEQEEKKYRDRY